jgi:N-acetylmuramoyl-L-alanine amidase
MKIHKALRAFTVVCIALLIVMFSAPTPVQAFSPRNLVYGSRGDDVYELQNRLRFIGYYWGDIDGKFGWDTYWAVRTFQYNMGMDVTGKVDMPTKIRLVNATRNWHYSAPAGSAAAASNPGAGTNQNGQPVDTSSDAPAVMNGISRSDMNLLAHLVYGEARGEPFEGQVAIAAVILNRLRDPRFPHSIPAIMFQPGAFTATADGQAYLNPDSEAMRAVVEAVNGWDPTSGAVYYFNPATATNKWIWSRPIVKRIGHHIFCR